MRLKNVIINMGQSNNKHQQSMMMALPQIPQLYVQKQNQNNILQHPQLKAVKVYTVLLNGFEREKYHQHILFRNKHPEFVQILYGKVIKNQKDYAKLNLYIEYLPITLQQLSNIKFNQLLIIFHKALKGFQILCKEYGSFQPQPTMIAFNEQGQVKVWMNSKFSKYFPKVSYKMVSEQTMIKSLTQIFMNKVDPNTLPSHQGRKFYFQAKTFTQAISIVQGQFQSKEAIPSHLGSMMRMLSEESEKSKQEQNMSDLLVRKMNKTVRFSYTSDENNVEKTHRKINITYGDRSSRSVSGQKINFITRSMEKTVRKGHSLIKFNYK